MRKRLAVLTAAGEHNLPDKVGTQCIAVTARTHLTQWQRDKAAASGSAEIVSTGGSLAPSMSQMCPEVEAPVQTFQFTWHEGWPHHAQIQHYCCNCFMWAHATRIPGTLIERVQHPSAGCQL